MAPGHRELLAGVLSEEGEASAAAACHVFSRQPAAGKAAADPDERLRQVLLGQVAAGLARRVPKEQQRSYTVPTPLDPDSPTGHRWEGQTEEAQEKGKGGT